MMSQDSQSGEMEDAGGPAGSALRRVLPQDEVDRPLAALARDYRDGDTTGRHSHARAQLLYATRGVMRIATDRARDGSGRRPAQ